MRRSGADPQDAAVDLLRVEVDPLAAEVALLRLEADRLSAEVDPLRTATVLIIGANYAPEQTGIGPHTTAMARDLAAIAERVMVLTGAAAESGQLPRIPGQTRRTVEHDRGVHLVRHRHHVTSRSGRLSRARFERSFLRAVLGTPLRNAPDLVIGVLPSVGGAVAAARLAQRFQVPLVLVVQDLDAGLTGDGGLIGSALARGQAEALRQAARVVLVGSRLRASVIALGVPRNRIDVLANWAPAAREVPQPVDARARIGLAPDGFVAVHVGNMGFGQDVPTLVRAAHRIDTADRSGAEAAGSAGDLRITAADPLRLVLVGEGSQRAGLEAAAVDLPEVRFLDPVTARDYPRLLAAADVLVASELPGSPDRTLPSRLESYLRAGRPVVAAINPDGHAGRVLRSVPGAVLVVPAGDDRALASVLLRLRDDERERSLLLAAARGYAEAALRGTGDGREFRDVVRAVLTAPPRRPEC